VTGYRLQVTGAFFSRIIMAANYQKVNMAIGRDFTGQARGYVAGGGAALNGQRATSNEQRTTGE
jgi:hypothetical protein